MHKLTSLLTHVSRQTDVKHGKITTHDGIPCVRVTIICPFTKKRRWCYYNDAGTLIETENI